MGEWGERVVEWVGGPRRTGMCRQGDPQGIDPLRKLVTDDPPSRPPDPEDAKAAPQVIRVSGELIPGGPALSRTWAPRNQLRRWSRRDGPCGTRIGFRMITTGPASSIAWAYGSHLRRRTPHVGPERTRIRA